MYELPPLHKLRSPLLKQRTVAQTEDAQGRSELAQGRQLAQVYKLPPLHRVRLSQSGRLKWCKQSTLHLYHY